MWRRLIPTEQRECNIDSLVAQYQEYLWRHKIGDRAEQVLVDAFEREVERLDNEWISTLLSEGIFSHPTLAQHFRIEVIND